MPTGIAPADFPCGRMRPQGGLVSDKFAGGSERRRRVSLTPVAGLERALDPGCDQGEGCRERGVYTQIGGIEQGGVGGLFQRGDGAGSVGVRRGP